MTFINNIHFIGIGGSGMSGLAKCCLDLGYRVSGSDSNPSAVTQSLEKSGSVIFNTQNEENIINADLVVFSSAISTSNIELKSAIDQKKTIVHRSELLAYLSFGKKSLVVCGTHGKTTTSAMLASTLMKLNKETSYVIGGKLTETANSGKLGSGQFMVIEGDESDASFLNLHPNLIILTNINDDHLDFFKNSQEIFEVFYHLCLKIPKFGFLIYCADDPTATKLALRLKCKKLSYGIQNSADVRAININNTSEGVFFSPQVMGQTKETIQLPLPGNHNVLNALACLAASHALELDYSNFSHGLNEFKGVDQRFQKIGCVGHFLFYDDYAHNPQKIQSALSGARASYPRDKIVAIFEPHRFTRIASLYADFCTSFHNADEVWIAPLFTAGESDSSGYNAKKFGEDITSDSNVTSLKLFTSLEEITQTLKEQVKQMAESPKTVYVTLGAGKIKSVLDFLKPKSNN